ncbi:hypothetical protein MJ575_28000 [Klebsiella pneumoniae]|nr:hypothetical protein MJ575_28000 [Klebsiella pneumoniae]
MVRHQRVRTSCAITAAQGADHRNDRQPKRSLRVKLLVIGRDDNTCCWRAKGIAQGNISVPRQQRHRGTGISNPAAACHCMDAELRTDRSVTFAELKNL